MITRSSERGPDFGDFTSSTTQKVSRKVVILIIQKSSRKVRILKLFSTPKVSRKVVILIIQKSSRKVRILKVLG